MGLVTSEIVSSSPLALQLDDVRASYSQHTDDVLRGVSLDVEHGQFVSILGRSGVGKTTALRAIAGFERIKSGYIRINGQLMSSNFLHVAPDKRKVGFVFQDYALFPNMTVKQNIAFGLTRGSSQEKSRVVSEMMEMLGVMECSERYPRELSGGQQQRIAIARALVCRPHTLLLDEPFSNLDIEVKQKLRNDLTRILNELETATLMVTHNRDDALSLSNQIAVMCDGVIKQCGAPQEVYRFPCSSDVAAVCGPCSFVKGVYDNGFAVTSIGKLKLKQGELVPKFNNGDPLSLLVRPVAFDIVPSDTSEYGCSIADRSFRGSTLEYTIRLPSNETIKLAQLSSEPSELSGNVMLKPRPGVEFIAFSH